jgi:predicted RNA-binding Zn-ribbon protein involved in translation (DUF1610 family)
MSVPSTRTVFTNLMADGAEELANAILSEAVMYRCPECNMAHRNPGVTLGDGPGPVAGRVVVFYCPWCSEERVRPDGL